MERLNIKEALRNYIDACIVIKDTQEEIRELESSRVQVNDVVKGSLREFPYTQTRYHVSGSIMVPVDKKKLALQKQILQDRIRKAEVTKNQVEEFLEDVPLRLQRIIRYKYFDRLTWYEVADRMGETGTSESVRKEIERYLGRI